MNNASAMLKKNAFLFLLLLATCSRAFGQIKEFKGMGHVYKNWLSRGACDTLYYFDKISPKVLDQTIDLVSSSDNFRLHDLYIGTETDPLILSPTEKSYLIGELKKLKEFSWPAKLFPKSKRISQTEMGSVFKTTEAFPEEKYHSCSLIYSFSKPIYLRNGKICLFIEEEVFSASNTRLMVQFFEKIDNNWEEYADIHTHFAEEGSPSKNTTDTLIANIIRSQDNSGLFAPSVSKPEKLEDFAKRVIFTFDSLNNVPFSHLYPTLDQRIQMADKRGLPVRKKSPKFASNNQALAITRFDYECLVALDTAKALKVNWVKVTYSNVTEFDMVIPIKNSEGKEIIIKNLIIGFQESKRKFQLQLGDVFFIDEVWKTTSVIGLKEIK